MLLTRRRLAILLPLVFCAILMYTFSLHHLFHWQPLAVSFSHPKGPNTSVPVESSRSQVSSEEVRLLSLPDNGSLDMFSHIFVVSRPTRLDRRSSMEQLRATLGLEWKFVDAIWSQDPDVEKLQDCVRLHRKHTPGRQFHWPSDEEFGSVSSSAFLPNGSLPWQSIPTPCTYPAPTALTSLNTSSPLDTSEVVQPSAAITTFLQPRAMLPPMPLTCAVQDRTHGVKYKSSLPSFMLLTPPKLACWYSHLDAILRFIHGRPGLGQAALILEDDVDMERDIDARLQDVWQILPADWDIVFLGESQVLYHAWIFH